MMTLLGVLLIGCGLGWGYGRLEALRIVRERDRDRRFMRTYREQLIAAKRELRGR